MLPVVCEGDTETFLPCSKDHGGGTYAIPALRSCVYYVCPSSVQTDGVPAAVVPGTLCGVGGVGDGAAVRTVPACTAAGQCGVGSGG